jgi:adenylate cyclase
MSSRTLGGDDHATAIDTIRNALAMNPTSATANYNAAHIYQLAGDYVQAALYADRALRLSPRDPLAFQAFYAYGFKAMHEGRYGEAASWFAKGAQVTGGAVHTYFGQAACLALAGSVNEGRAIVKHMSVSPSACAQMYSQTGIARASADKLNEGARLLEAPE